MWKLRPNWEHQADRPPAAVSLGHILWIVSLSLWHNRKNFELLCRDVSNFPELFWYCWNSSNYDQSCNKLWLRLSSDLPNWVNWQWNIIIYVSPSRSRAPVADNKRNRLSKTMGLALTDPLMTASINGQDYDPDVCWARAFSTTLSIVFTVEPIMNSVRILLLFLSCSVLLPVVYSLDSLAKSTEFMWCP